MTTYIRIATKFGAVALLTLGLGACNLINTEQTASTTDTINAGSTIAAVGIPSTRDALI